MKADGRLGRNHLLGAAGDAMNALLVAAGHNLRLILNFVGFVSLGSWQPCWVHPRNRILPTDPGIQSPPDQTALFRAD